MIALTISNAIRAASYAAILALVAFAGVQTVRVNSLKADLVAAKIEAQGLRATISQVSQLRDQEQAQAATSYTELSSRCDARVQQAGKAASIIEGITNGHRNDAGTTAGSLGAVPGATRTLVPAGELRGIIGQAADRQAAGVPGGGKPSAAR